MIQREKIVRLFNPVLHGADTGSPLTVGNGDFAFTADVTGLQTYYDLYAEDCPLLTMSNWGWHRTLLEDGTYPVRDKSLMTAYQHRGRRVYYPVAETEANRTLYRWFRENPHRINLCCIRLLLDGRLVEPGQQTEVCQELDMFTGIMKTSYILAGKAVKVTSCVGDEDTLAIRIESDLCGGRLAVALDFPYPSPGKTASDFRREDRHSVRVFDKNYLHIIEHKMDEDSYACLVNGEINGSLEGTRYLLTSKQAGELVFTLSFGPNKDKLVPEIYKKAVAESEARFYLLWNKGAFFDVTGSTDKRAKELQRRLVQSMYLSFVQGLGCLPPQETGLTCNSWYGKFHLEMHPIHAAYAPLYGRGDLLEKSLGWYLKSLPAAKDNAAANGYKGARWPKMTGPEAIDSPSPIAPLLVWQQPHIIYMLELIYRSRYGDKPVEVADISRQDFLEAYGDLVENTAEFMADFVAYNEELDLYELLPPLYSVQEKGDPEAIKNPAFEVSYFAFGLRLAYDWMLRLGKEKSQWLEIAGKMAKPYIADGKYAAYEDYYDTYTKLNLDHPSFIYAYALLEGEDLDKEVCLRSLKEIERSWDFKSLWGWDFALLAMTYARLGYMNRAFDMLMLESDKNTYVTSGNNYQRSRSDLPLYLPGNGSLLLAMTALRNCEGWYIRTEGLMPYPFYD